MSRRQLFYAAIIVSLVGFSLGVCAATALASFG